MTGNIFDKPAANHKCRCQNVGFWLLVIMSSFVSIGMSSQAQEQIPRNQNGSVSDSKIKAIVDQIGKSEFETSKAVGLCIGVATREKIIHVQGFGLASIEHDIPVSAKTVFRVGSITKMFTAAGTLLLVEDGRVGLDDQITKFIPEYPLPGGNGTVRQLLHHTSGIKDLTRLPTFRRDRQLTATPEEILGRFKDLPMDFKSNEKHRYCNSGYLVLAMIIEKASGKTFADFARERLFKPAGLQAAVCDDQSRIIRHRATGYSRWTGEVRNAAHVNVKSSTGSGNIAATAPDLLKWQQALMAHKVVNRNSFRLMTTKGKLNNSSEFGYGMGYFIRRLGPHKTIRHGGAISGFRAELLCLPESNLIVVVQSNSHNTNVRKIADKLALRIVSASGK